MFSYGLGDSRDSLSAAGVPPDDVKPGGCGCSSSGGLRQNRHRRGFTRADAQDYKITNIIVSILRFISEHLHEKENSIGR